MEIALIISISIINLILTGILVFITYVVFKMLKMKAENDQKMIELNKTTPDHRNQVAEYSKEVIDFIREVTSQISVLKFRTWRDSHDMTKITKSNVESLISDIVRMVKDSLSLGNIDPFSSLVNSSFYDVYIVETTVYLVKDMLEKEVDYDGIK